MLMLRPSCVYNYSIGLEFYILQVRMKFQTVMIIYEYPEMCARVDCVVVFSRSK